MAYNPLYPWMTETGTGSAGAGGVPFLSPQAPVPQQPAQAPIAPPASPGVLGTLRNLINPAGAMQGPAPEFASAGGAALNPFISQSQNVPYFPPPPAPSGGGGVPMPQPRPAGAPMGENPTRTGLEGGGKTGQGLMDALRGVKAPAPPQAQTVRTPPPPQLAPIRGGEFVSMLSSLGITPQEFIRMRMGGLGGR